MNKTAQTDYDIHPLINQRWSPRAFRNEMPPRDALLRLFEAARWAPSSGNGQPWQFVVTSIENPQAYEKLFATLHPANQAWVGSAPLLVMAVMEALRDNGRSNLWAPYDLGQAVANLAIQATAEGLFVHQMAGFDREQAKVAFNLPEQFEPMTVFVIGYPGDPDSLSDDLRERELAPRERKPLSSFTFEDEWGQPLER